MTKELTEEEIMLDDLDPMDAIRQIRRDEGVAEEDLPEREETSSTAPNNDEERLPADGEDELAELGKQDDEDEEDPKPAVADDKTPDAEGDAAADPVGDAGEDKDAGKGEADPESGSDEAGEGEGKPAKAEKPEVKTRQFRANGQDFTFTEDEILTQFETVFGQAMDYTKKMQKMAPFRKMISALETQGVSEEQLNTAIDALKGDKGALKKILADNKIDSYDLQEEDEDATPYTPGNYGKDEQTLAIEEITHNIQGDEEYKITVDVIDKQWDDDSREAILKNPTMITGLHNDIKTGLYDKVAPVAMKMKVLDRNSKSDIEYYMLAGEQLRLAEAAQDGTSTPAAKTAADLNAEAQAEVDELDEASSEAKRKRAAASTGSRADRKVIDYLDDDNDEAFDDWYKKLQASI